MWKVVFFATIFFALSGCSTIKSSFSHDFFIQEPTLSQETKTGKLLGKLPPARRAIDVAVYDFKDYTGQHKPGNFAQYSRAVTQGGVAILKKALFDAGKQRWFRVLERGGINHLLQERRIVETMRSQYSNANGKQLPPLKSLLYSGLLLEGGIISYESNTITGGLGARYLGIGGNTEYRRDVVSVYLRAVQVATGEILLAVDASKTIFSTKLNAGLFKFVSFDEILEAEGGFSYNEPPQLAVKQAIEMAVYGLIMEGVRKKIWAFKDKGAGKTAFTEYLTRLGEIKSEKPKKEKATMQAKAPAPQKQNISKKEKDKLASKAAPTEKAKSAPAKYKQRSKKKLAKPWYVQVIAVRPDKIQAGQEAVKLLKGAGFPVAVQKTKVNDNQFIRVLVGPYTNKANANKNLERVRMMSSKYSDSFVRHIQ